MQVIPNENTVFIDCDDTIVLWTDPHTPGKNKVEVRFTDDVTVYLTPHFYHIELVKRYKERGYAVTVWSANGVSHAVNVVRALGLESHVDFVMTKPAKHMDDSPDAAAILGPRIFTKDFLAKDNTLGYEAQILVPYNGSEYYQGNVELGYAGTRDASSRTIDLIVETKHTSAGPIVIVEPSFDNTSTTARKDLGYCGL